MSMVFSKSTGRLMLRGRSHCGQRLLYCDTFLCRATCWDSCLDIPKQMNFKQSVLVLVSLFVSSAETYLW